MFIISTWDLKAVTPGNSFFKYADDASLVVPASNSSTIATELANVADWSRINNQTLNITKSSELIISLRWTRGLVLPPPLPDIPRVNNLLLLGVTLDNHLLFAPHVTKTLAQGSQSIHALKVLKTSGLPIRSLTSVCRATLVARLLYAAPCWWGSISEADKLRLQATLRRAVTWGVCSSPPFDFLGLCASADQALFQTVMADNHHVLWPLLPPLRPRTHNLRNRGHPYVLPIRDRFTQANFIRRMLFAKL